jgi:CRISPR/Cas system-associated exonuclease Cas4 (RecB family)
MIKIEEALHNHLETKRKVFPQHTNRISQLDDPCARRLFYQRTAWDKATPKDDNFVGVLETGNELESVIGRVISQIGESAEPKFRIIGQQTTTNDDLLKKYQISGSIDGFLQIQDADKWQTLGVVDIKTANPTIYQSLSDFQSLAKYSWTKRYRGQLMLYALAHNLEKCFLLFVNKSNLYQMKLIEFDLDYAYAESLIQKADYVNKAIETNEPPDKLNSPDECPKCPFASICNPEYSTGGNLQISDDVELEGILRRLKDLELVAEEIADLEKIRDNILVKGQDLACGPFMILWKKVIKQMKDAEAKSIEYWQKKIVYKE